MGKRNDTPKYVQVGDPITRVDGPRVILDVVQIVADLGNVEFYSGTGFSSGGITGYRYLYADEGRLWIRGHHLPSSPDVQALMAAMALTDLEVGRQKQVIPPSIAAGALIGGLAAAFLANLKAKQ